MGRHKGPGWCGGEIREAGRVGDLGEGKEKVGTWKGLDETAVTCLKDGLLCGGTIVAALLPIAQLPHLRAGLIERLHSAESDVQLIPVVLHHVCQIVHINVIVCWCQVVCTPQIATANKYQYPAMGAAFINMVSAAGYLKTKCDETKEIDVTAVVLPCCEGNDV